MVSLPDFEQLCAAQPSVHVVETLIPEASVCIAVGDSGLGKSAWAYQLWMCVASGKLFLEHPAHQGPVLYIDLENGRDGILGVTHALKKHLAIVDELREFYLLTDRDNLHAMEQTVARHRPRLVVIDSLRPFRPEAEEKPTYAATLLNEQRDIATKYRAAFLLIHHIKKPGENGVPAREDTPTMTWLLQSCGARALVNQSDVRIAFDSSSGIQRSVAEANRTKSCRSLSEDVGLVVKGFARLRGEFGPLYLARSFDEEGTRRKHVGRNRMEGKQESVGLHNNHECPETSGDLRQSLDPRTSDRHAGKRVAAICRESWLELCGVPGPGPEWSEAGTTGIER
ncbi:MAG TPA: AAA family ATPase, partial [Ktedonobacteraceae bacterium]